MDSLTQFALGAAVGEALLGKKIGKKAMLWGGVCGTIPDLDVFIPMGNAVADFTFHRSFSHSLFILAFLTPLVAWLAMKIHKQPKELKHQWWLMVYLVFVTHVLLDSFTAYGTQIFWPIVPTPVSFSSIFIVDPLYTVPLLVGLTAVLITNRHKGYRWNLWGIAISSLYLSWTAGAKVYVEDKIHEGLHNQGIFDYSLFTTPTPFNSLLWRGVAKTESGYYEVYFSIFDSTPPKNSIYVESDIRLLERIKTNWSVLRLQWFSKGFYNVKLKNNKVVIADLRMGAEPTYVFQFSVAELKGDNTINLIEAERVEPPRDFALSKMWDRIWSANVNLSPVQEFSSTRTSIVDD